jgi:hypothetical protein
MPGELPTFLCRFNTSTIRQKKTFKSSLALSNPPGPPFVKGGAGGFSRRKLGRFIFIDLEGENE